jgi:hypothetical protein
VSSPGACQTGRPKQRASPVATSSSSRAQSQCILWCHHCCRHHCLHHNSKANLPEDHIYSSWYCGFYS